MEKINEDIVFLSHKEYEDLMEKMDDDNYIPSLLEESTLYAFENQLFFIIRRYKQNYLIYKD